MNQILNQLLTKKIQISIKSHQILRGKIVKKRHKRAIKALINKRVNLVGRHSQEATDTLLNKKRKIL